MGVYRRALESHTVEEPGLFSSLSKHIVQGRTDDVEGNTCRLFIRWVLSASPTSDQYSNISALCTTMCFSPYAFFYTTGMKWLARLVLGALDLSERAHVSETSNITSCDTMTTRTPPMTTTKVKVTKMAGLATKQQPIQQRRRQQEK